MLRPFRFCFEVPLPISLRPILWIPALRVQDAKRNSLRFPDIVSPLRSVVRIRGKYRAPCLYSCFIDLVGENHRPNRSRKSRLCSCSNAVDAFPSHQLPLRVSNRLGGRCAIVVANGRTIRGWRQMCSGRGVPDSCQGILSGLRLQHFQFLGITVGGLAVMCRPLERPTIVGLSERIASTFTVANICLVTATHQCKKRTFISSRQGSRPKCGLSGNTA